MSTFDAGAIEARLILDRSEFQKGVASARKTAATLDGKEIEMHLKLEGLEDLLEIATAIEELDSETITVGFDVDASDEFARLSALIEGLDGQTIDVNVDADTAAAQANLAAIEAVAESIEANNIELQVQTRGVFTAVAELELLNERIDAIDEFVTVHVNTMGDDGKPLDSSGGALGFWRLAIYSIIALLPILTTSVGVLAGALAGLTGILVGAGGATGVFAAGLIGLSARLKKAREDGAAMSKPMQEASDALDHLKDAWNSFLDEIEDSGFSVMADGLNIVSRILEDMAPIFNAVADVVSDAMGRLDQFFDTGKWLGVLDFFEHFGAIATGSLLDSIGNLILFLVNLGIAFEPLATTMLNGLERSTAAWAEWADNLPNDPEFLDFLNWISERGPQVIDFLIAMGAAFIKIGEALDPLAGPMLDGFTSLFNTIADADTQTVTAVTGTLLALFATFKLGVPAVQGLVGAFGSEGLLGVLGLTGGAAAIGAAAVALGALVGWLVLTTDTGKSFTNMWESFGGVWDVLQEQFHNIVGIIKDVIGALEDTGAIEQFQQAFTHIAEVFQQLLPFLTPIAQVLGVVIVGALTTLAYGLNFTAQAWQAFLQPAIWVVNKIAELFNWLYDILLGHSIIPDIVNGTIAWFAQLPGRVGALILSLVQNVIGFFGSLLSRGLGIFSSLGSGIASRTSSAVNNIRGKWNAFISFFGGLRGKFASMIGGWFSNLAGRGSAVIGAIKDKFNSMVTFFKGLKGRISSAASGMFSGITSAFKSAINAVIRGWNGLDFHFGGKKLKGLPDIPAFTIGTPDVPLLASGGIVTDPTLIMAGEGNESEAVLPLSELAAMLDRERNTTINPDFAGRDDENGPSSKEMVDAIDRLIDEIRNLASRSPIEYNDYGQRRSIHSIAEDLWLMTKERG